MNLYTGFHVKNVNQSCERFDQLCYLIDLCFDFADVVTIEKTGEYFRLIYDVKGRFTIHRITAEEAKVNEVLYIFICRVTKCMQEPPQKNF
jgi:hypothetical protein